MKRIKECPICGGTNFVFDKISGEMYCTLCGSNVEQYRRK